MSDLTPVAPAEHRRRGRRSHDRGVSHLHGAATVRSAVVSGLIATAVTAFDFWLLTQTSEPILERVLCATIAVVVAAELVAWRRPARRRIAVTVLVAMALLSAGTGSWIGANSPKVSWFGPLVSHGPRGSARVALTFDDGPNATATLEVAHILDAGGTKGTFFEVGKALDARPDIAKALIDDGHLVANHSYTHDYLHWLDPFYRELGRTQRAFERRLGVCPAFFRPPHGQHTPFMAAVVGHRSMSMIGWDVSVGDFDAQDPAVIARRVLRAARPGSIIDLHDGLDGEVHADRRVLVRAMPLILAGLAHKGLRPVRLDELLGRSGYLSSC